MKQLLFIFFLSLPVFVHAQKKTEFLPCDSTVLIPNSFNGNGDGINDHFKPVFQNGDPEKYVLKIFNRWGELIFETKEVNAGWTGSMKDNRRCEMGVYVYIIEYKFKHENFFHQCKGHVTLIR